MRSRRRTAAVAAAFLPLLIPSVQPWTASNTGSVSSASIAPGASLRFSPDSGRQFPEATVQLPSTTTSTARMTRVRATRSRSVPRPTTGPATSAGHNWAALAACESGGRNVATGRYRGFYQFDDRTWHSVTGRSDNANNASGDEQLAAARALFAQRGRQPWPVCGSRL